MTDYKIYNMDDYSALYEDGLMVRDGDQHYIHEYLEQKLGVVNVDEENFIDPETDRAFDTLEALEASNKGHSGVGLVTSPQIASDPDVFLAGGISGTTDWQARVGSDLVKAGLQVANPRRPGMMSDPTLEPAQVEWEIDHLERSKVIVFWFPGPGDHPIAMYELGRWAATDKPLIVGCPPDYKRRVNLVKQLEKMRPDVTVQSTLIQVMDEAARAAKDRS